MHEPSLIQDLQRAALHWSRRAAAEGWLSAQDVARLEGLDNRIPDTLFENSANRPLVVAFFGGTGVGKSTLLNRLAGEEVARTGILRPTSREISVYLHDSVRLRPLSTQYPIEKVHIVRHTNETYRHVLWVDMPDFDSTDRSNHELALEWLPQIDVLIYVVSPERYRDDKGWRILLAHEQDHAWIFVMNQWDRGHPLQLDDFKKLLGQGGFADPVLYRTDSRPEVGDRKNDDFTQLEDMIRGLADRRVLEQLSRHNLEGRMHALTATLSSLVEKLGSDASFRRLREYWDALWRETSDKLWRGLDWPIRELASRFVQREGDPLRRSMNLRTGAHPEAPATQDQPTVSLLWDEWTQLCFDDTLDRLILEADNMGLPPPPLKESLRPLRTRASRTVLDQAQTALRQALAHPGNVWQRLILKLSGLLAVIAPVAAIAWVSEEVVVRYYQSVHAHTPFLGTDFAIHSGLLIAVAWLFPYTLYRKLRPSAERTARRGIQTGIRLAFDELSESVAQQLSALQGSAQSLQNEALNILDRRREWTQESAGVSSEPVFGRLLATPR